MGISIIEKGEIETKPNDEPGYSPAEDLDKKIFEMKMSNARTWFRISYISMLIVFAVQVSLIIYVILNPSVMTKFQVWTGIIFGVPFSTLLVFANRQADKSLSRATELYCFLQLKYLDSEGDATISVLVEKLLESPSLRKNPKLRKRL
jgi:hypothetical protein